MTFLLDTLFNRTFYRESDVVLSFAICLIFYLEFDQVYWLFNYILLPVEISVADRDCHCTF